MTYMANWQMLFVGTAILSSIVNGVAAARALSVTEGGVSGTNGETGIASSNNVKNVKSEMYDGNIANHKNKPAYASVLSQWQPLQTAQHYRYRLDSMKAASENGKLGATQRRSYSSSSNGGLHGALFNGLTNLSGLQHISNGYAAVAPTTSSATSTSAWSSSSSSYPKQTEAITTKQEIPIYEDQNEDGEHESSYADSVYATENNHHQQHFQLQQLQQLEPHSSAGLRTAIYNLHAAGAHNGGFLPTTFTGGLSNSGNYHQARALSSKSASLPSSSSSSSWSSALPSTPQHQHELFAQSNDKISVGNFLHHYDHNSGYDVEQEHEYGQQQLQQHHHHQPSYFTPSSHDVSSATAIANDAAAANVGLPDSSPSAPGIHDDYDEGTNYLPHASSLPDAQQHQQEHHHTDVINYVPYPVVKKLHVPVEKPVQIPVSQAVIVPIRKPVPIHIPISQHVQVPVEKELKIPVERLVPYPVEKHVPVPVEKRVPFPVVKYVPVKVPRPFPVKVPVFKTVLHKMKSWW